MAEVAELLEGRESEGVDTQRLMEVVRRRHMHFLLPLFVGWLAVWAVSWILPARYQSTTLILVEQPSMPKDYVSPNVSEDLQDRLQSITQQILSRSRLLSIIDKLRLYAGSGSQATPDGKVDQMRKDIDIELVHSENTKEITGFTIGYSAQNPQIAQQVTSELTDLFINDNLKARQQESEDTTKFMESELETARTTLAEQEAKVREYEAKHEGELPSLQASNLQILSGLQTQLQGEQDALNTAKQQGIYLQSMVAQYREIGSSPAGVDGSPSDLQEIDKELEALRAKLADLSSHYTDRYPDLRSLKSEIAKTEKKRDDLQAQLASKSTGDTPSSTGATVHDAASVAQNSPLLQLESQQVANKTEVANREEAINALKARIGEYQARLNNEPTREQELADLTRGYDQSKAHFDDLLKKKNESEMATSMEQMQQGERFKMLDPPSLPVKPTSPNRLKLCGIGLGVGFVLGLAVAGIFEVLDARMYNDKEIKTLIPASIVAEIPVITIPFDIRNCKRRSVLGWATGGLVFAAIAVGSALSYLRG